MGFIELALIGLGLSMDAFAVSICKGLSMPNFDVKRSLILAISFGVFQGLMPVIGFYLGSSFASFIEPVDHWIAFILLVIIGSKMIYDAMTEDGCEQGRCESDGGMDAKEIFALSIATSIDALAVGVSFAVLDVNILDAACLIGLITFALSLIGVAIGHAFGSKLERKALVLGGVILILIGVKILLEHLGVISFSL